MSQVQGPDENFGFHRGRGGHKKDPTQPDFLKNRWVQRDSSTQISSISCSLPARSSPRFTVMALAPFPPLPSTIPADKPSFLASQLPPQHHEVDFNLTHKAESPIVWPQKRASYHRQDYVLMLVGTF